VSGGASHDWDADWYDRISDPQLAWGREVLERLPLRGDEAVLDAGCGTGRVTQLLVERLPRGRVIGVDASPSMVEKARATLGGVADVRLADLADFELDAPVDAVFSNAVFHWVPDSAKLFGALYACLVPDGRLVAQCGGEGNVASVSAAISEAGSRAPFAEFRPDLERAWTFRSAEAAARSLEAAGFIDVRCWLEPKPVTPAEPHPYLATAVLPLHLERLPEELREPFVAAVVEQMPRPTTLDYVRLNIAARRPGE